MPYPPYKFRPPYLRYKCTELKEIFQIDALNIYSAKSFSKVQDLLPFPFKNPFSVVEMSLVRATGNSWWISTIMIVSK